MAEIEKHNFKHQNLQSATVNSVMNHKKTINPSIASIQSITESRKEQHQAPVVKPATSPVTTSDTKATNALLEVTQHSVYPEATRGFGVHKDIPTTPIATSTEKSPVDVNIARRVTAIKFVALLLMLMFGIGFYNWYELAQAGLAGWLGLVELLIMFGLIIGIYRLIEMARITYVIIAAVVLLLTCVGILNVFRVTHSFKLYPVLNTEHLIYDAIILLTSIVPIVFLTRPSIRSLFG